MISRILTISPGLIIAFLIYIISHYLSDFVGKQILGYEKSPISTILFAIILGIIVGNTFNINKKYIDGLNFSTKFVLRLGIVLMGIKLSLSDIFFFGLSSIPLIVICILSVIIVIYLFRKIFNISPQLSYLIAIGTSICGATAIVATAPVINAKKGEITYAIANITIFGSFKVGEVDFCIKQIFSAIFSIIPKDPIGLVLESIEFLIWLIKSISLFLFSFEL